jgi:hypothetical protein
MLTVSSAMAFSKSFLCTNFSCGKMTVMEEDFIKIWEYSSIGIVQLKEKVVKVKGFTVQNVILPSVVLGT